MVLEVLNFSTPQNNTSLSSLEELLSMQVCSDVTSYTGVSSTMSFLQMHLKSSLPEVLHPSHLKFVYLYSQHLLILCLCLSNDKRTTCQKLEHSIVADTAFNRLLAII